MVDCKICGHPLCSHAGEQREILFGCSGYMPKPKPKTNADRIRAMSDEELARTFAQTGNCPPSSKYGHNCERCGKCWLDYLRQPMKDGDNE
jgi:hypothetical protein